MNTKLYCLRCEVEMQYLTREKLDLGHSSWLFGNFSSRVGGALEFSVHGCPNCGKLEFFHTEPQLFKADSRSFGYFIGQTYCNSCGKYHDVDLGECPFCQHNHFHK